MKTKVAALMVGVGMLLAAVPVWAHHAFAAEFDKTKPVKLQGTITQMEWINPHTWIHVDVKRQGGNVEKWMIEAGPPNSLLRRGLAKTLLPVGAEIVVEGYLAKDSSLRANGRDVTFADGRKFFLGSSGTGAPADGRDPTERKDPTKR
jgi:hypothetical protein